MDIQRTITVLLPEDADLRHTLDLFQAVQQRVSATCFNAGIPLSALALQRAVYHEVKGSLSSQMTITALRRVAGAYVSAKRNKRPATSPFAFTRKAAIYLIGKRGRDADFRADGTLSIWTPAGRKRIAYSVPDGLRPTFDAATEYDSLTIIERDGQMIGRLALTLTVPASTGTLPVGVDLNETNALVAVDTANRVVFVSGKATNVANTRTRKTRQRVQRKHAARKAERRDTRSVRRVLKRLGRRQRHRTKTFCQTAAKRLVQWVPADSVIVLEDLRLPQQSKRSYQRNGVRRRLSQWSFGQMRSCLAAKAEERGIAVALINPAYTSQDCSRCGLRGVRRKHRFACPYCGHAMHADVNAAVNIRNRYTVLRGGGLSSTSPEAQPSGVGKLPASAGSR